MSILPMNSRSDSTTSRDSILFPILFVSFTIGIILPIVYGAGSPYFDAARITPPLLTQALMTISPIAMISAAVLISIGLIIAQKKLSSIRFRWTSWLTIAVAAASTLVGILAFLSPLYAIALAIRG